MKPEHNLRIFYPVEHKGAQHKIQQLIYWVHQLTLKLENISKL